MIPGRAPTPRPSAISEDTATYGALKAGQPQNMLVTFDAPSSAPGSAAASKAAVFAPASAPSKAGVRLVQDYSMLPISLVAVPDFKALEALQKDPNVLSVSPNRRAYPMAPAAPAGGAPRPAGAGFTLGGARMGLGRLD